MEHSKYEIMVGHSLALEQHGENGYQLVCVTQSSIVKRCERKAIELAVMVFLFGSFWKVDVLRKVA